jgi:hypothetical protein
MLALYEVVTFRRLEQYEVFAAGDVFEELQIGAKQTFESGKRLCVFSSDLFSLLVQDVSLL